MFVLCPNNPTRAGDPAECGGEGYFARLGDIRHSFMAYLPDYMTYGLLGLGPSNTDPETGEIISGMAYVYHHNDTAAWDVAEMIELLSGAAARIRLSMAPILRIGLSLSMTLVARFGSRTARRCSAYD